MSNLTKEKKMAQYILLTIGLIALGLLSIYSNGDRCDGVNPDTLSIVFVSNRDGNYEIYKMGYGGDRQTRLTDNEVEDSSPKWSPDKTKIIFVRNLEENNKEIFVMAPDGKNEKNLTNSPGNDYAPVWSPDGSKIAYISAGSDLDSLIVTDTEGTNKKIIAKEKYLSDLSWSPDSKMIAFSFVEVFSFRQIAVVVIENKKRKNLFTSKTAIYIHPAWSPDGSWLAYRRLSSKTGIWKWKVNLDEINGEEEHIKLAEIGDEYLLQSEYAIRWSTFEMRNGSYRIAYVDIRDGNVNIYSVNSDGNENKQLTNSEYSKCGQCDWDQFNGLVFWGHSEESDNSDIYKITEEGRLFKIKRLTIDSAYDGMPDW
jgi:TolB protein